KKGGEDRGVKIGVSAMRSRSRKLFPTLYLPSSDTKSCCVSSVIVQRDLGGLARR
ncbi:hypothetical protein GW17_00025544, partial [Ensete ventricosum]